MSDNIPFEIQMQIIKKVSDVKSLVQFRSVSKPWKSFIDSSEFVKGYGARHTQPHSHILSYKSNIFKDEPNFICLIDDDMNETLKVQKQELAPFVMSPLLKQYGFRGVVGACHGLLCLSCYDENTRREMLVIWNPSIGKSFGIHVPSYDPQFKIAYGFGVCPITSDPTVVKIRRSYNNKKPLRVEVFTLSSGVWSVLPSSNLPRETIGTISSHVDIDRFIYWGSCCDVTSANSKSIVLSFDLITKELKVVDLPDSLTKELLGALPVSVSKLRGSLVVSGVVKGTLFCGVWVMEHDSSFTKLFCTQHSEIVGFRKNGETIFETRMEDGQFRTLEVYNPHSQQIKNLEINVVASSFFMDSYKQSLLLLDHSDSHIYSDDN